MYVILPSGRSFDVPDEVALYIRELEKVNQPASAPAAPKAEKAGKP